MNSLCLSVYVRISVDIETLFVIECRLQSNKCCLSSWPVDSCLYNEVMITDETFLEFAKAIKSQKRKEAADPVAFRLKQRGIDIKKLKRQKNSIRSGIAQAKYNAAGSKLKIINDARAEAARQKRMMSPDYDKAIKHIVDEADKKVNETQVHEPLKMQPEPIRPAVKILKNPIFDMGSSRGYPDNLNPYSHQIYPEKFTETNRGKNKKPKTYYW
jgi:hypothetical protein